MTIALTSDHQLLDVLRGLPTPVIICDTASGEVLWAHVPDLALLGASDPKEAVGRNLLEFLAPDQHAVALRDIARIAAGEEHVPAVVYRLMRLDGGTSSVHISSTAITFDGAPAMLSVMVDVSDREETLRELQDSEERYRSLIDALPEALVISVGAEIRYVNRAAVEYFGASAPGDLVGRSLYDLVDPESRDSVGKRQRQIYRTGGELPVVELQLRRLDGTSFAAVLHSNLVRWHGEPAMQTLARILGDHTL